jgi:hypothetical protein
MDKRQAEPGYGADALPAMNWRGRDKSRTMGKAAKGFLVISPS